MSTVVLDGLDPLTTSELLENYCQRYGRILNCYTKSSQCTVTFADRHHAEEFVRESPHRIHTSACVRAKLQATLKRSSPPAGKSTCENSRLIIRGCADQLDERKLVEYFSQFGSIRMCSTNSSHGYATISFDDARTSENAVLKQTRHFLHGRSLSIERCTDQSEKRMKSIDVSPSSSSNLTEENNQLRIEQQRLQAQLHECTQLHAFEKLQWSANLLTLQNEHNRNIAHYQTLLKQNFDELMKKDQQVQLLKQENKDIDDLLRQSVHDNEQQQIHLRKREETHNRTKRNYAELYKVYVKLKEHDATANDTPLVETTSTSNSTRDQVKKKL